MYNQAHALANALKESQEFQEYKKHHAIVMQNETQKKMVEDYRTKIMAVQMDMAQGKQPDEKKMEELRSLETLLTANSQVKSFLEAEQRLATVYGDIQKILNDAIAIDEK